MKFRLKPNKAISEKRYAGCLLAIALVLGIMVTIQWLMAAADEFPTRFSNRGGIYNTRHNITQSSIIDPPISQAMITVRNNYGEVCVYCHTPHGSNANIDAPLWNRTVKTNTYTLYEPLFFGMMNQTVSPPGPKSLTCLSCHDGTVAIDSIVNMPGSGRYSEASKTSHQEQFLDSWPGNAPKHHSLGGELPNPDENNNVNCISCHNPDFGVAPDFRVFYISLDLRNDHPVGVERPTDRVGFAQPNLQNDFFAFYDTNSNQRMDVEEIRFYQSGGKYKVECASCHDPHGVPSDSADLNSEHNPSFLRRQNPNGSRVCLTCHIR